MERQYLGFYNEYNEEVMQTAQSVLDQITAPHACDAGNHCQHEYYDVVMHGVKMGVQHTHTGLFFAHAWADDSVEAMCVPWVTAHDPHVMKLQICDYITYMLSGVGP
jgi:hypothetical protein